jgi:hypothetical protein
MYLVSILRKTAKASTTTLSAEAVVTHLLVTFKDVDDPLTVVRQVTSWAS